MQTATTQLNDMQNLILFVGRGGGKRVSRIFLVMAAWSGTILSQEFISGRGNYVELKSKKRNVSSKN